MQLIMTWLLEGTESSNKSDMVKNGILLSHTGKEEREVCIQTLCMKLSDRGDNQKVIKHLEDISPHENT